MVKWYGPEPEPGAGSLGHLQDALYVFGGYGGSGGDLRASGACACSADAVSTLLFRAASRLAAQLQVMHEVD